MRAIVQQFNEVNEEKLSSKGDKVEKNGCRGAWRDDLVLIKEVFKDLR